MAPPTTSQRVAELEAHRDKYDLQITVILKELDNTRMYMDELKEAVRLMHQNQELANRALWGSNADPVREPGVVREVARIDRKVEETNRILTEFSAEVRGAVRKIVWGVFSMVGVALLSLILKYPIH
jgi:hypothetical protein